MEHPPYRAVVYLNTGTPAPDGSSVGFTTSCGMVTPFGQTLGGVATATFTAPSIPPSSGICTVTASIGGQSGIADVHVTTSLTVQPDTQTINGVIGGIATFTIYGGVAPYTVTSSNTAFPPYLSGNEFTVNVGENSIPRTITYTVRDNIGATDTVTLTIGGGASLAVLPSSVTVDSAAPDDTVYFTIFGGVAPYTVFSDNQAYQPIIASSDHFSIFVPAGAPDGTIVLTVIDSSEQGDTVTASVDIAIVPPQPLAVIPASQTIANPAINNAADYTVIGGKGPYSAFSDKPGFATVSVAGSTVTALVAAVPTEDTTVTISIYDSLGNSVKASLILDLSPLGPLAVIPTSQTISNPAGGETADFQVIGGSGGYIAFSSNPAAASVAVAGSVVTATVGIPPTTDTTVTITIYDSAGSNKTATLILDLSPLIPLAVIPSAQTISNPAAGNARNFTVIGGTGGYTAFSDNPIAADVAVAGSVVTATVGTPPTTDTTVKITIYDSAGSNVAASLILDISPVGAISVIPESVTVTGFTNVDANAADDVTFYISGGTGPYSMYSDNNAVIASQGSLGPGIGDFTIDPQAVSVSTTVKLTVTDSVGATDTVSVTVNPASSSMAINPSTITVVHPTTITYNIIGGLPGFTVYSSDLGVVTVGGNPAAVAGTSFVATTVAPGTAKIYVVDSDGKTVNADVTVNASPVVPPAPGTTLSMTINPINVIGLANPDGGNTSDDVNITIANGTPPYIVTSNNPALTPSGTWSFPAAPTNQFLTDVNNVGAETEVTFTVVDNAGASAQATLTIFPLTTSLSISVNKLDVIGIPAALEGNGTDDVTFTVTGGTPPYLISKGGPVNFCTPWSNPCTAYNGPYSIGASGGQVAIDPQGVAATETVTLTVTDNAGAITTATFRVHPD